MSPEKLARPLIAIETSKLDGNEKGNLLRIYR